MHSDVKNKAIRITVGIPTYEAGDSLVTALESLYHQTYFDHIERVMVVVDGNTIPGRILHKIHNPKLAVVYASQRKGQPSRINDIFNDAHTDLVILTNDDVVLSNDAIEHIVRNFRKTSADLLSCSVTPLPEKTLLERILKVGYEINRSIYLSWNNADNYLSCNGRLLVLSKRFYKTVTVPEKVWNNDAFLYLFAKVHNFSYAHEENAIASYRMPTRLGEHIKQSSKFKQSLEENNNYFRSNIATFYTIPPLLFFRSVFVSLLSKPVLTSFYIMVSLITAFSLVPLNSAFGYWETDSSTKKI
ncbi:glycosyltransferase family 2 protein [Candidatus Roizmanbacteria bacterium]|nr:glycosyltransferase family 2 protein [Candidatus Roizmanbacteria bacterium]